MSFELNTREVEGIAILDLRGRLAIPHTSLLREKGAAILAEGGTRVILDFSATPFIDSTGLGVLVALHSDFKKAGGAIKLLNLSKRHLELLVLTKLSIVFEVFDDERAAIDSFFPDRERRGFDILEFVRSQQKPPKDEPT